MQYPMCGLFPSNDYEVLESLIETMKRIQDDLDTKIDYKDFFDIFVAMFLFNLVHFMCTGHMIWSIPDPYQNIDNITKTVSLQEKQKQDLEEESSCDICYDNFEKESIYFELPCCKTEYSTKKLHAQCAVNCLRVSDKCPFCKSAYIRF